MIQKLFILISVLGIFSSCMKHKDKNYDVYMAVGTYTQKESEGVYLLKLNTETGESLFVDTLEVENPSYLTISSTQDKMYIVTESNDMMRDAVHQVAIDKEKGKLQLEHSILTQGAAPCYVLEIPSSHKVVTANYMSGSISVFTQDDNNNLVDLVEIIPFLGNGPIKERQEQSHLHCVYLSPDDHYLFANDLGSDKIYRFNLDSVGLGLSDVCFSLKPGAGPRHTVFHPNQKWAYTITELSGEVVAYKYQDGILHEFQSIIADSLQVQGSGDIQISPNGKFLYASNRLAGDGVAIFRVDPKTGGLERIGYQFTGKHPRNINITPNGKYLVVACRDEDSIEFYEIDYKTGRLLPTPFSINISMPVCIKFFSN